MCCCCLVVWFLLLFFVPVPGFELRALHLQVLYHLSHATSPCLYGKKAFAHVGHRPVASSVLELSWYHPTAGGFRGWGQGMGVLHTLLTREWGDIFLLLQNVNWELENLPISCAHEGSCLLQQCKDRKVGNVWTFLFWDYYYIKKGERITGL
jgi:hypothetical protein